MNKLITRSWCVLCAGVGALLAAPAYAEHPVLKIPNVTDSIAGAEKILNTWPNDAGYVEKYVPHQSPRSDYGKYAPMVVPGDTSWSWDQSNPHQIKSKPSGTVFPGAAGYTEYTESVLVFSGKTVSVPYYLAAGSTTDKSLVQGNIDYYKTNKIYADLAILSDAYMDSGKTHAERNQDYARRICAILYEWAKYVPDYFMTEGTFGLKNTADIFIDAVPGFQVPYNMSYVGAYNSFGEEVPEEPIYAFDVIYDSPALAQFSLDMGVDARQFIQDNLLKVMGDFFVEHTTPEIGTQGNLPSVGRNLALMATTCGFDHYMSWIQEYYDYMLRTQFNREHVILEGMGYSLNFVRTVQDGCRFATKYFVEWPATTPAEEAFLADLNSYIDTLQEGADRFADIALPNRHLPAFGDTRDSAFFNTRDKATGVGSSSVLGAYGSLSLGAGNTMDSAIQLNQNYTGQGNHMRLDSGAFTLWAFGEEVLGNIRYCRGALERQFGEQPLAQNSVRIADAQANQVYVGTSTREEALDGVGDLTMYEPGEQGIGVSELDCGRLYDGYSDRYQRIMVLNSADLNQPYVLDVFRIQGTGNLDYTIHGSLHYDSTASCSETLNVHDLAYPFSDSATWVGAKPKDQYTNFAFENMFRNGDGDGKGTDTAMRRKLDGNFRVSFTAADPTNPDLNIWMSDRSFNQFAYLCESPTPTRSDTLPASMFDANLWRPSFIVKNAPADSTFASVIEPKLRGTSGIVSSVNLPLNCAENDGTAFQITFADGRIDTWLINHKNPDVQGAGTGQDTIETADGKFKLTGRIALHSRGADSLKVWVMDATEFVHPDGTYVPAESLHYAGAITGETRLETGDSYNAFVTSTPLPVGTALRGKYMRLNFGALVRAGTDTEGMSEVFEIDEVVEVGGAYHIKTRYDHCLNITNGGADSREQRLPNRHFVGAHSFDIILSEGQDASFISGNAAVQNGALNDPATWGVPVPVSGDTNVWLSGSQTLKMETGSETFNGNTLAIQAGGKFIPGVANATLSLNGLLLAGGEIYMGNNLGLNMDLGGNTLQLDGGVLRSGAVNSSRYIRFRNAVLAGEGTIQILGKDTFGSDVEFEDTVDFSGFTGVFAVSDFGVLNLSAITPSNASFGLELTGTGRYLNDADVTVTSLKIGGVTMAPGIYAYADFTPAQQAFLIDSRGVIAVLNDPTGDTDGDGTSDGAEVEARRKLDSATDLAFEFNTDAEGWVAFKNVTNELVAAGTYQAKTVTNDPIMTREGLNFSGDEVPNVLVKLRASEAAQVQLYWGNADSSSYAGKLLNAGYTAAGEWQVVSFPTSSHTDWAGQTIVKLRLDPIAAADATFEIDWIRASDGDYDKDGIADVDEGAGDSDGDGRLDIEAPPTVYEVWAGARKLSGKMLDDDDADGILNIHEYALGGNPTNGIADVKVPTISVRSNWFEFVHAERSGSGVPVQYSVERSDSLVNPEWTTESVIYGGAGPLDGEFNTVTNRISTDGLDKRFMRLKVW